MKILLCGYHEAGYRALRTLVARRHDVLVATHPTPEGIPSVGDYARSLDLPCVEGSTEEVQAAASRFKPDLVLSMYYRAILPDDILALPPRGALNFHPSLLPRHAGCFSAVWAILEGERRTGVTCHRMIGRVDAGDIIDVISIPIDDDDTGYSLYHKLVDVALILLQRVLRQLEIGQVQGVPQEGPRSYHSRGVPCDGLVDPTWSRARIDRFIRALYFPPFPPASIERQGTRFGVCSIEEYDQIVGAPCTGDWGAS